MECPTARNCPTAPAHPAGDPGLLLRPTAHRRRPDNPRLLAHTVESTRLRDTRTLQARYEDASIWHMQNRNVPPNTFVCPNANKHWRVCRERSRHQAF
eukprot:1176345-Prorocentrum_minimum.AAC.5